MNKFIRAIKDVHVDSIKELIQKEPKWIEWCEDNGKNALHYLCGVTISNDPVKAAAGFQILKLLLKAGMNINSIHKIPDNCGVFPATPLWYAYTRERNEQIFNYLLKNGADPGHCMFAIAWYDDVESPACLRSMRLQLMTTPTGALRFLRHSCGRSSRLQSGFYKMGRM